MKCHIADASDEELDRLQKELSSSLKAIIKRGPNTMTSFYYLFRDIAIIAALGIASHSLEPYVHPFILTPIHIALMGTAFGGLWVLGHECGHGCFSRNKVINDGVGFLCHSFLLNPYWSWKYTHGKHHKYTNHTEYGETWVPCLTNESVFLGKLPYLRVMATTAGLTAYVCGRNTARTTYTLEPKQAGKSNSHFSRKSQAVPDTFFVTLSAWGVYGMLGLLFWAYTKTSLWWVMKWHLLPYTICNAWVVIYTALHHTDLYNPHYGKDKFTFLRGAVSTIDRDYGWLINSWHHTIGLYHVVHHIYSTIPHYYHAEATEIAKGVMGKYYMKDDTPIIKAIWTSLNRCQHIEGLEGVQYYLAE